jgi:hypothetical protein
LFYYCGFFIFVPIFFCFSLYYQLYHHHLLIPTLTTFTLPPSSVLKYITLLPNYSFCPFSSTPSPPTFPQPVTRLPISPTHSPPADQSTIPTLHNPKPLQSRTQALYTTKTEIHSDTHKGHKTNSPCTTSLTHPPHFRVLF